MNAYSEDLRKKIVEALRRGAGKSAVARAFGVSLSSVERYAKMDDQGRPLAPKKRPGSRPKMGEGARRPTSRPDRPPRSPRSGLTWGGWPGWR